MLTNGDFEAEWEGSHRCYIIPGDTAYYADIGNIFTPPNWTVWYKHNATYAQPEGRDARGTDPPRMRGGAKGYLLFTFGRRHDGGLFQQVQVAPGTQLRFSAFAHAWSNHKDPDKPEDFPHPDDPVWSEGAGYYRIAWLTASLKLTGIPQEDAKANFAFSVGIDPTGGVDPYKDTVVWSEPWSIYNAYVKKLDVEATAVADTITVFLRSTTAWSFKHNDAYWDDARLTIVEGPHETYERAVHLLPQTLTRAEYDAGVDVAIANKASIVQSAHDAFITHPDLTKRTVHVWAADRWGGQEALENWALQRYPPLPELHYRAFPEPDPNPDPPPGTGWIGVHQLQNQPEGLETFMAIRPRLGKAVDRIDQIIKMWQLTADAMKPHMRLFFRKYHPQEGLFRYDPEKAVYWINFVAKDLADELPRAGVPTDQVWILGLNEVWEYDATNNAATIKFDLRALTELEKFNHQYGTRFKYAASSMAVGNPQRPDEPGGEEMWAMILPLAQALRDFPYNDEHGSCCFNYHGYGLCIADQPAILAEYAPWLQHRWMYYYKWLHDRGAPVPFFHGEGGHVGGSVSSASSLYGYGAPLTATTATSQIVAIPARGEILILVKRSQLYRPPDLSISAQGMWLNPGQGWRGLIPPARAVTELVKEFDAPIELFNAAHAYKTSYGMTTFQWGNRSDWINFNQEELAAPLASALQARYPDPGGHNTGR